MCRTYCAFQALLVLIPTIFGSVFILITYELSKEKNTSFALVETLRYVSLVCYVTGMLMLFQCFYIHLHRDWSILTIRDVMCCSTLWFDFISTDALPNWFENDDIEQQHQPFPTNPIPIPSPTLFSYSESDPPPSYQEVMEMESMTSSPIDEDHEDSEQDVASSRCFSRPLSVIHEEQEDEENEDFSRPLPYSPPCLLTLTK